MAIKLPRTVLSIGSDNLKDILVDELQTLVHELPTERACWDGGLPKDEQVRVDGLELTPDGLRAQVAVFFVETIPSSCADLSSQEDRYVRFELSLDASSTLAVVGRGQRIGPAQR